MKIKSYIALIAVLLGVVCATSSCELFPREGEISKPTKVLDKYEDFRNGKKNIVAIYNKSDLTETGNRKKSALAVPSQYTITDENSSYIMFDDHYTGYVDNAYLFDLISMAAKEWQNVSLEALEDSVRKCKMVFKEGTNRKYAWLMANPTFYRHYYTSMEELPKMVTLYLDNMKDSIKNRQMLQAIDKAFCNSHKNKINYILTDDGHGFITYTGNYNDKVFSTVKASRIDSLDTNLARFDMLDLPKGILVYKASLAK